MITSLYVEINVICILILALLLFKIGVSAYIPQVQKSLNKVLILLILLFASDSIWTLIDTGYISSNKELCYLVNILYFSFSAFLAYAWLIYVGKVVNIKAFYNKFYLGLFSIPSIILLFLSITTITSGFIFYIDDNLKYNRGPINILPSIFMCIYIAAASIMALYSVIKNEQPVNRPVFLSLALFPVFPVIAITLSVINPKYQFIPVGMTLPLLLIYLKMVDVQILSDSTTLLNNKNWFLLNHERLVAKFNNNESYPFSSLYLLLIGVDTFEEILESEEATKLDEYTMNFGDILTMQTSKLDDINSLQICRYNQDTFLAIVNASSLEAVNNLTTSISNDIKKNATCGLLPSKWHCLYAFEKYNVSTTDIIANIHHLDAELFKTKQREKLY